MYKFYVAFIVICLLLFTYDAYGMTKYADGSLMLTAEEVINIENNLKVMEEERSTFENERNTAINIILELKDQMEKAEKFKCI